LLGIVLIERAIDPDEYFLGEIFSGVGARGKAIGQVVNSTRERLHNLFPSRTVSCATSSYQIGAFVGSQAFCGSHVQLSPGSLVSSEKASAAVSHGALRPAERQSSVSAGFGQEVLAPTN